MHVDFDSAAAAGYGLEESSPKIVASFGDAAFTVNAERETGYCRTAFQEMRQCVPAVIGVILGVQALDVVIGVGRIDPFIGVRPKPELEIESALDRLLAYEAQHFEITVALGVGQVGGANFVTGNFEQEWIGEKGSRRRSPGA